MSDLHRYSFSVIIYFLALSLVGLCLLPLLPVKLVPEKSQPELTVSFSLQGQAPRTVESEVTAKLEAMLSLVEGVRHVQSVSYNNGGVIRLSLDEAADVDVARLEVATVVRQTWPQLPDRVSYPQVRQGYTDGRARQPALVYRLNAPASSQQIDDYARQYLLPQLARLDGVSGVEVSGVRPMEWGLEYDSRQLERLGLEEGHLRQALGRALDSEFLGMGAVWNADGWRRHCSVFLKSWQTDSLDVLRQTTALVGGKKMRLGELVKVAYREQKPYSLTRINGQPAITLSVYAAPEANQLRVGRAVRGELARLDRALPQGYDLRLEYDASEYLLDEIGNIALRTGLSVLLLLLFVLAVSRSLRYLGVITCSLAANLSIAFGCYYVLDIELQLYSLAGITISLGLVIDNLIVMADHLAHRRRIGVFLAILAATLTTVSALGVVFLLDYHTRLNLEDFALVVIVNLAVSLAVSLFLLPALLNWAGHSPLSGGGRLVDGRGMARLNGFYVLLLRGCSRHRRWLYALAILGFGLPVFLIPTRLPDEAWGAGLYNAILGSPAGMSAHLWVDRILGGTLRVFLQRPQRGQGFQERGETRLDIHAYLPHGATIEEMDKTVRRMECSISGYRGVRQFQTRVQSAQHALISVYFTRWGEQRGVPYQMKSELVGRAVGLGNATWTLVGVGDGFNNRLYSDWADFRIEMRGYNYDELMAQALRLRGHLMEHRRIREVRILPDPHSGDSDYEEYLFAARPEALARKRLHVGHLHAAAMPMLARHNVVAQVWTEGELVPVRLQSAQSSQYSVWDVENRLRAWQAVPFRLSQMASLKREQMPQHISKADQQYQLYLEYDYIGDGQQGRDIQKSVLAKYKAEAPMGYTARTQAYDEWGSGGDGTVFGALLGIALLIYAICCVLFNSFVRPIPVLLIIPLSYIGVFVSFGLLDIPFGQGGFAAFVLLSGLTCNSVIYLLNDYYALLRMGSLPGMRAYLRAFRGKIIPILLSILSTILGFLPFLWDAGQDSFWQSLALGTIAGLLFSLLGVCVYLPVLLGVGRGDERKSF